MANTSNRYKAYIVSNGYLRKHNVNIQGQKYAPNVTYEETDYFNVDCSLTDYNRKNGLIFVNNEPYQLQLHFYKIDFADETCTAEYSVFNARGAKVYPTNSEYAPIFQKDGTQSNELKFENNYKLSFNLEPLRNDLFNTSYGTFTLKVKVTNQDNLSKIFVFPFSRIYQQHSNVNKCWTNVNMHFTSGSGDAATKIRLAQQAGFTAWRATLPWQSLEKNGQWTMPLALLDAMEETKNSGMRALIILAYGNDDYGEVNPNNEIWLNGYTNYCRAVAELLGREGYEDCVDFEIWNEWNHPTVGKVPAAYRDGTNYAKLVNSASRAVKEFLPNAKIVGGSVAGDPEDWIREMFEYSDEHGRTLDLIDAFSFHTYPTDKNNNFLSPEQYNYTAIINHIKDLLEEFGCADKEIWLTETGWATNKAGMNFVQGVSEETAAAYMTRFYIQNEVSGIKKVFWYDFMDDGINITNREHNYGLIQNWNSVAKKTPYAAKRGYVAMSALNSILGAATYEAENTNLENVFAHAFRKTQGTQRVLIVWSDQADKKLKLSCTGDFVIYNMYGTATNYTKNNTYEITLSPLPIYIQCSASDRLTPTVA